MSDMTELRDSEGQFLGMVDVVVPDERRFVRLPVATPFTVSVIDVQSVQMTAIETIELSRQRWRETDGSERAIWRLERGDAHQLARVSRLYVVGATCDTEYGSACKYIEIMTALCIKIALFKWDISCQTIH